MLRSTYPRRAWETSRILSTGQQTRKKKKWRTGTREKDAGRRTMETMATMAMRIRAYARKTWYRRHRRRLLRPPRHGGIPIYGTWRNARVRGGNLDSDIELSVNVSFFPYRSLAGSLPRLRIRSYIEIVSDISTLSFFPSRLVKYRRCVRASREARKQRKRDGESGEERERWQTMAQEKGREREENGREPEGRETVCIKARS